MDDSAGDAQPPVGTSGTGDLLYQAFYGGAVGGAVVALFFLVVDSLAGRPLYTPSLLGEVLFTDADPAMVGTVRLDMVAYYSGVHLASFLLLGAFVSYLRRATGLSKGNLPVMTGLIFVVLTVGFLVGDLLVLQGVADVIGIPMILSANFITALTMALFLRKAPVEG